SVSAAVIATCSLAPRQCSEAHKLAAKNHPTNSPARRGLGKGKKTDQDRAEHGEDEKRQWKERGEQHLKHLEPLPVPEPVNEADSSDGDCDQEPEPLRHRKARACCHLVYRRLGNLAGTLVSGSWQCRRGFRFARLGIGGGWGLKALDRFFLALRFLLLWFLQASGRVLLFLGRPLAPCLDPTGSA